MTSGLVALGAGLASVLAYEIVALLLVHLDMIQEQVTGLIVRN